MQCPKCGSDVYDNRPKKAAGEFKANAPDFKCQDKDCGWVQWPDRGKKKATEPIIIGYAQNTQPSAPIVQPEALQPHSGPSGRDAAIVAMFWDSFDNVLEGIAKRKLTDLFRAENVASLVATQFIQRAKG